MTINICCAIRDECDGGQPDVWKDPQIFARMSKVLDQSTFWGTGKAGVRTCGSLKAALCDDGAGVRPARRLIPWLGRWTSRGDQTSWIVSFPICAMILVNTGSSGTRRTTGRKSRRMTGNPSPHSRSIASPSRESKDPDAIQRLATLIQVVQWEIDFAAGKPISIKVDQKMTGFEGIRSHWSLAKEGGFTGAANSLLKVRTICAADFGDAWEVKTEFEFGVHRATGMPPASCSVSRAQDELGVLIQSDPAALFIRLGESNNLATAQAAVLRGINTMTVRRDGKMLTVFLNGQQLYSGPALAHDPQHQARIGFGGNPVYRGDSIHFEIRNHPQALPQGVVPPTGKRRGRPTPAAIKGANDDGDFAAFGRRLPGMDIGVISLPAFVAAQASPAPATPANPGAALSLQEPLPLVPGAKVVTLWPKGSPMLRR